MTELVQTGNYRRLEADKIIATIDLLTARIDERFPSSGLGRVSRELRAVANDTQSRVVYIEQRNIPLRLATFAVIAGAVWLLIAILPFIDTSKTSADSIYTLLQGIEATMNIFVLIGAAILVLMSTEERVKRRRALTALHELRSLAHVIDMHQLPKDPASSRPPTVATTANSSGPQRVITNFELTRYLDYCSELLSLVAKVAALYAQSLPDDVVTDAVSDLERIATNLSQKIWQKITIIESKRFAMDTPSTPPAGTNTTTVTKSAFEPPGKTGA